MRSNLEPGSDAEAFEKALKFLDYRPRSSGETARRLKKWGYAPDVVAGAISRLSESGLLDDNLFAGTYVEELLRKGYGEMRVRRKLREKLIDREVIDLAMESYPAELERDRAVALAGKRAGRNTQGIDAAGRRRLTEYLIRMGFRPNIADSAAREVLGSDVDTESGPE